MNLLFPFGCTSLRAVYDVVSFHLWGSKFWPASLPVLGKIWGLRKHCSGVLSNSQVRLWVFAYQIKIFWGLFWGFFNAFYCVFALCLLRNEKYVWTWRFRLVLWTHEFCSCCTVALIVLPVFIHNSCLLKVLVPLVLLQQFLMELTRRGQEPLSALVNFGVTYLEDYSADYIIQQGGWVRRPHF